METLKLIKRLEVMDARLGDRLREDQERLEFSKEELVRLELIKASILYAGPNWTEEHYGDSIRRLTRLVITGKKF